MYAKWIDVDGRFAFSEADNGGVVLSDEEYAGLFSGQEDGKVIVQDEDGRPVLADPPAPTAAELTAIAIQKRDSLLQLAATRIAPLQDAVDLGDATTVEEQLLTEWKRYRVALGRLDLSSHPIQWPIEP